jgi:hypothetical protein
LDGVGSRHPRKSVIEMLAPVVTETRAATNVRVGVREETFQSQALSKAIYATGWDGSVVVTADRDGGFEVRTER